MKLKIVRNLPIPPRDTNPGKGYTQTLRTLKRRESVWLPNSTQAAQTLVAQIGGRFGDYGDLKKWPDGSRIRLFRARREGAGTRIWRVK